MLRVRLKRSKRPKCCHSKQAKHTRIFLNPLLGPEKLSFSEGNALITLSQLPTKSADHRAALMRGWHKGPSFFLVLRELQPLLIHFPHPDFSCLSKGVTCSCPVASQLLWPFRSGQPDVRQRGLFFLKRLLIHLCSHNLSDQRSGQPVLISAAFSQ